MLKFSGSTPKPSQLQNLDLDVTVLCLPGSLSVMMIVAVPWVDDTINVDSTVTLTVKISSASSTLSSKIPTLKSLHLNPASIWTGVCTVE